MKQELGLIGTIQIKKYKEDKLIQTYEYKNLITDIGKNNLLRLIGGDNSSPINRIALGDGNREASASDTILQNKLILLDVQRDYGISNRVNFLARVPEYTFPQIVNYKEAGLVHRGLSNEILISRVVFNDVIFQKPENSLSILYSLELRV